MTDTKDPEQVRPPESRAGPKPWSLWKLALLGGGVAGVLGAALAFLPFWNPSPPPMPPADAPMFLSPLESASRPADTNTPPLNLSLPIGEGAGRGDFVYATVRFLGQDHLFIVDTGASRTIVDTALQEQLGPKLVEPMITVLFSGKRVVLDRCPAPEFSINSQVLRNKVPGVGIKDLGDLRRYTGSPIDGVLGMDILSNYVVQFDFAHRTLEMGDLKLNLPSYMGLPLEFNGGACNVVIPFMGVTESVVILDSGCVPEGGANAPLLARLPRNKVIARLVAPAASFPSSGRQNGVQAGEYTMDFTWKFRGVTFNHLVFDASEFSVFGLGMLADYTVTFDFPNKLVYFDSIQDTHINQTVAPVALMQMGTHVLAAPVTHPKILEPFDELLEIDGKPTADVELWRLREELAQARELKIQRSGRNLMVTMPR